MQNTIFTARTVNAARRLATAMVGVLILGLLTMGCPSPEPTKFTVTLNANTGALGTKSTISVESGKTATALTGTELPTRSGYTLSGWNTQADGKGTAFVFGTTVVNANLTIYAQWSQNAPATPVGLTASVISSTQINLAWTATATATTYKLFDGTTQIGGDITTTSYSHTGLTPSSMHSYTLQACNTGGCSVASAAVSATSNLINFTVTEIKNTGDIRPYYAAFKIKADYNLTDYTLALKEKAATAPTAAEMASGLVYKRNISSTEMNIYAWGAIGTIVSPSTNAATIRGMMLKPATTYTLYGMENGKTTVTALKEFTTDAEPSTKGSSVFYDNSLKVSDVNNAISFTVRIGEAHIWVVPFNLHSGTASFYDHDFSNSISACAASGYCTVTNNADNSYFASESRSVHVNQYWMTSKITATSNTTRLFQYFTDKYYIALKVEN